MTKEEMITKILGNEDLQNKIKVLELASTINPQFKNPVIIGGYLRDLILDRIPSDCDVVFEGYMKDQPGILECVREAEKQLNIEPYENWN